MRSHTHSRCLLAAALLVGLAALGCDLDGPSPKKPGADKPAQKSAPTKKVEIGKNVFLEVLPGGKRRVLVLAEVCRRTDQLEQLLCRKRTKEHEAILAADADARHIHTALIAAGAEPGHPVKFVPPDKRLPPTGTKIKVSLQYQDKGKTVTVPGQNWVRNAKTRKELHVDWVFAGSILIQDPLDPKAQPIYGANDGDVICLANFETALLDLPILSSTDAADLVFEAWTERIPALETRVTVILEPVPAGKKK
jgi:hypothetical protein